MTVGEFTHDYIGEYQDILQINIQIDYKENTQREETAPIAEGLNAAIASVEGIIDVQNTALNGREENLLLDPNAIPVRGVILCKQ